MLRALPLMDRHRLISRCAGGPFDDAGAMSRVGIRSRFGAVAGMALAILPVIAACDDPRFKEKEQRRYQRIDKLVYDYELIESRRGRQIEWFIDVERKNERRRQAELGPQLHTIDARFHKDVETTGDNLRELDEWSRGVLRGRLDAVPQYLLDVW